MAKPSSPKRKTESSTLSRSAKYDVHEFVSSCSCDSNACEGAYSCSVCNVEMEMHDYVMGISNAKRIRYFSD